MGRRQANRSGLMTVGVGVDFSELHREGMWVMVNLRLIRLYES